MSSVERWIEDKLEDGADKDALKQVLEDKGYDPEKVDAVAQENDSRSVDQIQGSNEDLTEVEDNREDARLDINQSSAPEDESGLDMKQVAAGLVLFLVSLVAGILVSGIVSI